MWIYYNCNPLKREVNDCVVRAISLAESKSWNYTYQKLSRLAKHEATLLDDTTFVEKYLNARYPTVCYRCNGKRMMVADFLREHPKGTYLISMKSHITCAKEGCIYDIWNCENERIWNVWEVD